MLSSYIRGRLVDVYEPRPDDFVVVCVYHRKMTRTASLPRAIDLLDGNRWCPVCQMVARAIIADVFE
jgi:hypothetical protein